MANATMLWERGVNTFLVHWVFTAGGGQEMSVSYNIMALGIEAVGIFRVWRVKAKTW